MTNDTFLSTWNTYQDAWAQVTPAERQELLNRSIAEDCVYTAPDTQRVGREALTAHIEQFQQDYPGASFKTRKLVQHHGQALTEWVLHDQKGAEVLPGASFARFGEDGRLTHMTGFFET